MENLYLIGLLISIPLLIWVINGKPKKEVMRKYSLKLRMFFLFPFYDRWKKEINSMDLIFFEEFLFRVNVWILFFLLIAFILILNNLILYMDGLGFFYGEK